ncbi:MAG: L-rhamnose isomerase [Planctomycetes bacterium GWF2_41_51]|nr:MAG: L-rhamnose isomerase [Planctomycetes bacterium GWF2_41_51]HBG25526.1 L-rhamnose isomerase [Phycisphaerales bacterium]
MNTAKIEKAYELAKEKYSALGINTQKAISGLSKIAISLHCWQGDDVGGFEKTGAELSGGGIQSTGNYPGKAKTIDQLRQDIDKALELIPGRHRLNLHACYLDNGGKFVERDQINIKHFQSWIDWARQRKIGLDFNPTFFSHSKADDGFTLSHSDKGIREFWIQHGIACRKIAEQIGKKLGYTTVTNFWVPDGYKDIPIDRKAPRERLADSLDKIFKYKINPKYNLDAVEGKLFGIGSESYVVGSHEFYMGYAATRKKLLCLDAGHFHPTEVISDKISSVLTFLDEILLHVSRPVRWDSDHVVILNDELYAISQELIRGGYLDRVHIGLDFFDASINRIAAWVIGTRSMLKSLLAALLEPITVLKQMEVKGDYTKRLALLETLKTLPFGAVWDYYCLKNDVLQETDWMQEVQKYELKVLNNRI